MVELRVIAYVLLGTLVLGLVTFVIRYMVGSEWRQSLVGRYMMYFMMTIAATFAYILVSPVIRDVWGKQYLDLVILALLNYGAWRLTWLLGKIQKGTYHKYLNKDDIYTRLAKRFRKGKHREREVEADTEEDIH